LADIIFRNKKYGWKGKCENKTALNVCILSSGFREKRPKKVFDQFVLLIANMTKRTKTNGKYYLTRQSKLIADSFKFNTLPDSILTQKRPPCALTN
jgi:hypothetical protein